MGGFNTYPALDIKQPASPLDRASKLNSLLGAQQQLQMGAMELENARQAQLESQTLRNLSKKNGYDIEKTLADAAASGNVSPQTLIKLKADHLKMQTDLASKEEKDLKNALDSGNLFAGALDAVKQMPVDKRADGAKSQLGILANQGINVAGVAKAIQALPDLSDETINGLEASLIGHNKSVEQELRRREVASTEAKEKREASTFAATQPGGTKEDIEQKYIRLQQQAQTGKLNPFDQAWVKAYEKKKELVPAFNFNLQGQGAPATPLNPRQEATVNAIMEGRQTAPSSFAQKSPYWQNIMGEVYKRDPQWSEQRAQLRKSFTQDKEIGAINTALGHVGVLNNAIDALNNGDVRVLNSIANKFGLETGSTPVATFKTIVHRVGPELTKAYVGAGGGQGERGTTEKDFDENLPPQTLKSNTAITAQLLRSKISSKAFQWNQNKSEGMPSFEDRFIMPEAKATLNKLNPPAAAFKAPTDAPPAPKEDGKLLKSGGQTIAVSKGGQWVQP